LDRGHHRLDNGYVDLEPVAWNRGRQPSDTERLDERQRHQRPTRRIRPLGAHKHRQVRGAVVVEVVVVSVVAVVAAKVPCRLSAIGAVDLRVHRHDTRETAAAAVRAQKPTHFPEDVGQTYRRPAIQRVHRVVPRTLGEHGDYRFGGRVQSAVVVGHERFASVLRGHVIRRQGEHDGVDVRLL